MNILWLSHIIPYPPTGLGVLQRSYNLVRELAREHRVYLLSFIQGGVLRELLGSLDTGLTEAAAHLGRFCAAVKFVDIPSERYRSSRHFLAAQSLVTHDPYTINWLKSDAMHAIASQWRDQYCPDLVHFDTISLAPYLSHFIGYPTTLDHHNIESHMMLRRAEIETNVFKRLYFSQEGRRLKRYEAQMCPQFTLNITCSKLDLMRLRLEVPGLNVVDVPNGVDTEYFHPIDGAEQPLSLVFAGNMSWYPNSAAMLFFADRVWPRLRELCPGVQMNVVGANPPARLRALAKCDSSFKVHGFVPDVREYLGRAAVYVCPLMDGGGTKLKVLDALAMGKPLVAHPIACEGIDVRQGESVVLAREAEEFVAEIAALLHDAERRQRMAVAARDLVVRSYSYTSIGHHLTEAMEHCVYISRAENVKHVG